MSSPFTHYLIAYRDYDIGQTEARYFQLTA